MSLAAQTRFCDETNVGPVPARLDTRKRVYSWAYHRMECLASTAGLCEADVKPISRLKAAKVCADHMLGA